MREEQELIARGYPLEDAVTLCHSLRRSGELSEFMQQEAQQHACTCGGQGNCPDCPNREK